MKVELKQITPNAEQFIVADVARISSSRKNKKEDIGKLIKYLIQNQHWSPFEHAHASYEITTSKAIAIQLLRHRSFVFQEFCISGDSLITVVSPKGKPHYISIEKLYKCQNWKQYKNIKLRVYDEEKKQFTTAPFKEVFYNGKKPVYKVYFEDGKTITCTKEHKFLTKTGFKRLEDALGLHFNKNIISMTKNTPLAVNGMPCYQNYEWLKLAKERAIKNKTGVTGISHESGVSYHTIRKWLKKMHLSFTKKEVAQYVNIWNKGKSGYKIKPRTREQKEYIRKITPKGENHHAYKGGGSALRKQIANYFNTYRPEIFAQYKYHCQLCQKPFNLYDGKIDLHHIKEVSLYPELAFDLSNVIPVHRKCHLEHHGKTYKWQEMRKNCKGNTLAPKFRNVIKIEYAGVQKTYDIHVNHKSHNYVANKIVVHNSQRYAVATDCEPVELRKQCENNRQSSADIINNTDLEDKVDNHLSDSMKLYEELISKDVAREVARMVLPMATQTTLIMTGNIRSWMHLFAVRDDEHAQKECRLIAQAIKKDLQPHFKYIKF